MLRYAFDTSLKRYVVDRRNYENVFDTIPSRKSLKNDATEMLQLKTKCTEFLMIICTYNKINTYTHKIINSLHYEHSAHIK